MEKNYNSKNITLCKDGQYRWVYELNMYTTTAIIKEVYRALLIGLAVVGLVTFFASIGNGFAKALEAAGYALGITGAILFVLGIIGYLIVAFMYNGKYCVLFAMDEDGILHAQQNKQVKKAQLIGAITALAGAASGKPGAVGTGILAGTRTSMSSSFNSVKVIEAEPGSNLIRLNGVLERNQVYVEDEDFGFVLNFIVSHCPNAEVKGDYAKYLNQAAFTAPRVERIEKKEATEEKKSSKVEAKTNDVHDEEIPKFCSNCGKPLNGGNFCSSCGAKIK